MGLEDTSRASQLRNSVTYFTKRLKSLNKVSVYLTYLHGSRLKLTLLNVK